MTVAMAKSAANHRACHGKSGASYHLRHDGPRSLSSVMSLPDHVIKLIVLIAVVILAVTVPPITTKTTTTSTTNSSSNPIHIAQPPPSHKLPSRPLNPTQPYNYPHSLVIKPDIIKSIRTENQLQRQLLASEAPASEASKEASRARVFKDKVRQAQELAWNCQQSSNQTNLSSDEAATTRAQICKFEIEPAHHSSNALHTNHSTIPGATKESEGATFMGAPGSDASTNGPRGWRFVRAVAQQTSASSATAATASQQIQTLTGERLIIPCRNSSKSYPALTAPADQPSRSRASGSLGTPPATRSRPSANGGAIGLNGAQFFTTGIALIVWHKDDQLNSPIFAVDSRGTTIKDAKQQAISESLKGRARVELIDSSLAGTTTGPPALIIEEAHLEDAGLYTCTVEFDRAPTQTYQASVGVFDPPRSMIIKEETNDNQVPLSSQLAGPYDEESRLVLICEAEPGQPVAGQVSWWQLDSVTQLGGELNNLAAAGGVPRSASGSTGARNMERHLAPAIPAETASHLTTLNLDPNDDPFHQAGAALSLTTGQGHGDFYLGPRSFHQQHQVSIQQLIGQLVASNLTAAMRSGGGSSGEANRVARLRHWRRVDSSNNKQTSAEDMASQRSIISARLEIQQLTRANLGAEFLCLAMNNQFAAPLNRSVILDLNLKPTEVRLVNKSNATFRLGQKTIVECHVIGSRPSAVIKWFRGAQEIEITNQNGGDDVSPGGASSKQYPDDLDASGADHDTSYPSSAPAFSEFNRDINNLTKISYLTLTAQISDNQQPLTCSASNPKLMLDHASSSLAQPAPPPLSDSIIMNVQFQPRLELKLGAGIRPDSIRLHSDIFMDCEIEANPPIQELVWLHEGRQLVANISSGIIMSNQSLVLRNINVHQRGAYECQARNSLGGPVTSNRLVLRPRFEPICDETLTKRRYEIPLNQPTRIECHVLAEPEDDLQFSWRFNRTSASSQSTELDNADQDESSVSSVDTNNELGVGQLDSTTIKQFETNFTKSSVIFTARSRRHFGQLLCGASNSMGKQERPCVIQLVQSELPEPVLGCFVDNQTHSSFSIHCQPSIASLPASSATTTTSGVGSTPSPSGGAISSSHSASLHKWPATSTSYILELYTSEQVAVSHSRTRERGSPAPPPGGSTHLMLRQPNDGSSVATGPDYDDGESQLADEQQQTRIRQLVSESPSFDVLDLRPNSTYNILIYVQNSKGRSAAAHHQVSTKPLLAGAETLAGAAGTNELELAAAASTATTNNASSGDGRLELLGKRARPSAPVLSASNQLLSFLKIDDYFSPGGPGSQSPHRSPLIGVALVVLLSTISIVMAVFFVNRLICANHSAATSTSARLQNRGKQTKTRKDSARGGNSSSVTNEEEEDDDEEELDREEDLTDYMRRKHSNNNSRPLTSVSARLATNADRCQKRAERRDPLGPGSGSDTSRETNTDSTLISSPAPLSKLTPKLLTDSNPSSREQQLSDFYCSGSSNKNSGSQGNGSQYQTTTSLAHVGKLKRCSHNDLSRLAAGGLIEGGRQSASQLQNATTTGHFKATTLTRPSTSLMMAMTTRPNTEDDQHQQLMVNLMRQQQVAYGPAYARAPLNGRLHANHQHALSSEHGPTMMHQSADGQSRGTPQVSLHSSECSSNNVDNSVELLSQHLGMSHENTGSYGHLHWLATRQHNYHQLDRKPYSSELGEHEQPDRLELKGITNQGGVYVLSEPENSGGLHHHHQDELDGHQIGLIPAGGPDLWCRAPEISDRNRCHLIDETPSQYLPSSFSIPNSLANRFDVPGTGSCGRSSSISGHNEQQQLQQRRQSSSDNLQLLRQHEHGQEHELHNHQQHSNSLTIGDCPLNDNYQRQEAAACGWPPSSSPCPVLEHAMSCQVSGVRFTPEAQTSMGQDHLAPPLNFATDYRSYQQTTLAGQGAEFDPNSAGRSRKLPAQHQQTANRHRVKFDTPNTDLDHGNM